MKQYSWFKDWRVTANKALEIQFEWLNPGICTEWFVLSLATRSKQDHAGIAFNFEFLKMIYFCINFYDTRHYLDPDDEIDIAKEPEDDDEEDQWNHS